MWTLLFVVLLLLSVGVAVAFAAFGDVLLTQLLRRFAPAVVGSKFSVSWSLREGSLELRNLVVGRHVLPKLEHLAGLPLDLERLEMEQFLLAVPLFDRVARVLRGESLSPDNKRMESKIQVAGLRLGLSLDAAERWMWERDENAARYQEAVKQAAIARLARVNTWTATIVQKLKDLENVRQLIRSSKEKKEDSAAPPKPAFWHLWVDELLDSFAIVTKAFSLSVRDEYSGSTIGMSLDELEIGRSGPSGDRRKRTVRMVNYEMVLNAKAGGSADTCYLIAPLSMEIGVFMPFIFQSLVMGQGTGERAFELEILITKGQDFVVELRPAQASMLMKLMQPLNFYYDWQTAATVEDDLACVQLSPAESEEYMMLFNQQCKLDKETGFLSKMHTRYKQKEVISARLARLGELEAKVLATRLLYLRSVALGWEIPTAGKPLPFVSEEILEKGNLRKFLENPVDHYVDKDAIPDTPPMLHLFRLSFKMTKMNICLLDDSDKKLMTFFAHSAEFELRYRMAKVAKNDTAVEIALEVARFGLLDNRGAPTNVFHQMMDRNPEAEAMMTIALSQRGDGFMDIAVIFKHFSLLLVFDPLLCITHVFMPAIFEDEKEQMRFVACEMADSMDSPEQRDAAAHIYEEDLPKPYSPLLLGGLSLGCNIMLQGCEFCLIGDSTTLKSPALAFTADTKLRIVSSERLEAVELELVDVALQPCTIILRDDDIDLDIGDVRSILELEGEGVDLSLGYRLSVGDASAASSKSLDSESSKGKSAASLWNVARKAASKKQIVEVEHPDIEEVEERVSSQSRRDRVKASARRKLTMQMSDFALNLSASDLGVLLSISASLNESLKEDVAVIKKREELEARMAKVRRRVEENRYMERLKDEFKLRDTDGGGTLDVSEIEGLLRSATNCDNLTKTEFDATVKDFVSIVDSDRSGDISLEEFESALSRNKILYTRLHHGVVAITGHEYVDPDMRRNKVPYLSGDSANTLSNAATLATFWEHYEEQIGASITSLNGQPPMVVQKKMVRAFKNYDYAQEAWNRLVNPSLVKPGEKSSWLLNKDMNMGSRGDVIDQLLSSLKDDTHSQASPNAGPVIEQQIFVQTVVSTSFGGFYIRLIDNMLPLGVSAIETSLEELGVYANLSIWEGSPSNAASDLRARKRLKNNFGVGKISFDVYGNYYNTKARQVEPFIEFYQGILDFKKEPETPLEVIYSSDRYFQLNITSAFMEAVNSNVAAFSKVELRTAVERLHINEEGGIFWMLNESGVNVKYYLVAKKQTKERVDEEVVTSVAAVSPGEAHACQLLNTGEAEEYERQNLKEKQLRQAFREADEDGSGELDTEEVRTVLRRVYEEEDKQRRTSGSRKSSAFKRSSSSILDNESEFAQAVEDFIALADTDKSGQVSWEEFKIAISKSRSTIDRYISVEIEGYRAIYDVPLSSIGQTQVYELTPLFEDVESENSIAALYDLGVALLTKVEKPTRQELQKAYACLSRVKNLDPNYEWIDSYYADCVRQYMPVLAAVHIFVDGFYGLQVKVSGAEYIRNALMTMRLCASETNRAPAWSAPFLVHLEAEREDFNRDTFEVQFDEGPNFIFHPQWEDHAPRTVFFYSPFWIQNRSGLDLRFKLSKGRVCTVEEHRAFFPGVKEIPLMVNAPSDKASINIRPFQETPRMYVGESLVSGKTKKYLPTFHKLAWSEPEDMTSVGTKGELRPSGSGDFSFVLAFEIRAAPTQFFRTKIFVISPRFVFLNHVPRPLQLTPILLDKKGNRSRDRDGAEHANCTLREGEAAVVYRLRGPEKYVAGLRLRDTANESQNVGEWSPNLPLFKLASKLSDPNVSYNMSEETVVWTRGSLGDGPACSISVHDVAETIFATVSDKSTNPNYRIENRSTRHSFRYVQHGVKTAEEIVLGPLESHSFAWEDPKSDLLLRVTATHWKVPTVVDFLQIGEVKNAPQGLYAEVYIDGSTRVFAMGDAKVFSDDRQRAFVSDWLTNTVIDVSMHGVGITIVDELPREIMNITMETIRFDSKAGSRRISLMTHHVQVDDMTANSAYPVVFAPLNTGFNSDKREGWLPGDGETPFFTLSIETLPQSGITIVNDFDLQLGSMAVKLNLEYLLGLSNLVFQFIPGSDEATILQQGLDAKNAMMLMDVPFPDGSVSAGMLMYFKRWRMSDYDFDLVFDSLQEDKGEGISTILGNTLGSIVGGIAHVTPEFHFGEIVYKNRFFYEYDLMYDVVLKIVHSVIGQWYKIVGSVEMLGDPVGLATDIVDGFALAARQLKRDVRGKSRRKGESAVTVVQTVFGVPLRSIGKVSNGLGDVVKKATYFESQENPNEPRHVPEGVVQSGVLLGKSIAYGVKGFVKEPVRGAKSGGVKGFAKGVGRGTLQLVASPVVGTLGVVEKMSQSMSNTTHLMDEKHFEGTRRPARNLQSSSLKQLSDSNVITEVEVHCLYIDGLPDNVNPKVVVRVYSQTNGYPAKEIGEFKTSTARHTGTPKYDQSWLIGVTSVDTFVEVNVFHKRKPLPKKRLGFVRLSMEDIYRDFESVPAKLLSDTNAKMQLKRRKRVRGSIISKLATANEHPVEVRDDSWRQRLNRPPKSGSSILSEDENEGFEDYDQEVSVLSGHSICLDEKYPPNPVGIPLEECESGATIYLSIRYVNDMRRLPYVRTASEIQEMKFWRAPVRESHRIVDPIKRAKNHTSRLINMQLGKLSAVTRKASLEFPALKNMHPFEREVVVLTLGKGTYEKHIQMLRRVYASLHNAGKQHERECQELRTKQEAIDCGLRCIEELQKIVDDNAGTLREAANMAKKLIYVFVQIADTPGLIFRPDESRNAIEKLAIAMMEKTQASIGFVFDPTGKSGTSVADQFQLRDELRHRVAATRPDHNWIDIISKIDQPSDDRAPLATRLGSSSLFSVSAQTNEGLMELGDGIRQVLTTAAAE
ncbi:Choline/ethanolaminephosphotransferase 1 [Phytophthora boehmeriae]|uniref:Choline/ethanolaminephosphotransferase 1 n=1 Tax=Phytophthora boehmeriae TaxID=109152 RepID=A0A8T1WVE6_9STRA|nr:Choline/ethanolaminephosphotransferase 1 [Phytophthora boehmeriae]